LKSGDSVIEISVGTGTNLSHIAEAVGDSGQIVGLDISRGMLGVCGRKLTEKRITADLVEGEAGHLPFVDGAFDAVFHHGGIAEFGDKRGAIAEMVRIVTPGGRVVVCDVGVGEDGQTPLMNRFLLQFQPEYNLPPPMSLIPDAAQNVRLRWYFGKSWYMIDFTKPSMA
jgi:ubiquinone/menaquinone biosynthesis C-methylase UbiE